VARAQASTELNGRVGMGGRDADEMDEDRREKELRTRLDRLFVKFCTETLDIARDHEHSIGDDNEMEKVNNAKMGFWGKPFKEMAFIQPTVHCLVNLVESDFFVVPVEEIEHIHFERVVLGKVRVPGVRGALTRPIVENVRPGRHPEEAAGAGRLGRGSAGAED
jgi:nucleosome binding factor SPN SPT16 subunit